MKKLWVIHPFLFALYPPLFLFSKNINKIPPSYVFLIAAISVFIALFTWILLSTILKSKTKAGLLITCFFIWLFYYRCLFEGGKRLPFLAESSIWRYKYIFSFWGLCFIFVIIFLIRSKKSFNNLTKILNFISLVLVCFCLIDIGAYALKDKNRFRTSLRSAVEIEQQVEPKDTTEERLSSSALLPDIYYIILDAYASYDSLRKYSGYDNSEFYTYLKERGFFIADKSRSNYDNTRPSLVSSLNMEYFHNLPDIPSGNVKDGKDDFSWWTWVYDPRTKNSSVARFLKSKGYKYITVNFEDSSAYRNLYYRGGEDAFVKYLFENYLFSMTFLERFLSVAGIDSSSVAQRNNTLFAFDALERMNKIKGPKFIFAHILPPHQPFVFGPNGERNTFIRSIRLGYRKLYIRQLIYISKKVEKLVESLDLIIG